MLCREPTRRRRHGRRPLRRLPRHAGADDSQDARCARAAARLRHRAPDRADQRRPTRPQPGHALPGAAQARADGVDRLEMGRVREQPPRPLLLDHPRRAEAAPRRDRELVARHRHRRALPEAVAGSRMTALRRLVSWLATLVHPRAADARIAEEIAEHLALATDDNIARGMSPEAARLAALRSFGGVVPPTETRREARGLAAPDGAHQDLRDPR